MLRAAVLLRVRRRRRAGASAGSCCPRLADVPDLAAHSVGPALAAVKGHPMAKAAVETAVLDAELRGRGVSFAELPRGGPGRGADRRVGRHRRRRSPRCSTRSAATSTQGYAADQAEDRARLGRRAGPRGAGALRRRCLLQVDANTAYTLADARHLARLDPFDLLLIEQPLAEDDLRGHAELARRLRTPVCLDESITSARAAADAIALGACAIVNIKAGRVGGYLEARRVHDVCAAHGVPVWCGGMLETGIGRAANVALAALPGFTLPGDTSASDRYYAPRPHRAVRAGRTASSGCPTAPVSAWSSTGPGWTRSPPGSSASRSDRALAALWPRSGRALAALWPPSRPCGPAPRGRGGGTSPRRWSGPAARRRRGRLRRRRRGR